MKLIIVESPTKAKTISSFLPKEYSVISSYGHVRDLPKSKLGVDVENDFSLQYVIPTKARKKVTELKKSAQKADEIILATDEDREGEAIAWHISQILDSAKPALKNTNYKRMVFHEITKPAIEEALAHPRSINTNLVDAQQARRALDRLVGYKLSPFLWKKVAKRLSAGRVQSVVLRLIVEREREIEAFVPQEYWTVDVTLDIKKSGDRLIASLESIEGTPLELGDIPNQKEADHIVRDLEQAAYAITKLTKKESKKNPLPPFITSTLQQEAFKKLGMSSKQTMRFAQGLYERGLITYMRTDSFNLSAQSTSAAQAWIQKHLGKTYALERPRHFSKKTKGAQEAHEAIRPTDPSLAPASMKTQRSATLETKQEEKLYELIWRRFIASQMTQAVVSTSTVLLEGRAKKTYGLKTTGSIIVFDGFLKIWQAKITEKEIPTLEQSDTLSFHEAMPLQHFTQPPARYNEASLIKLLEEYGIGRPSTYAPIISVIQTRNYVVKNEQRRFEPTEIGLKVNDLLVEHFPSIVDIQFTAKMEENLDDVAEGDASWHAIIKEFYTPFEKLLTEKYETVAKQAPEVEVTDEVCEKCGKPMVIKYSRFGKFLACSGFPECRNTKSLPGQQNGNGFDRKSFGNCPTCKEGEVIRRRTKKGRWFYGCSRYPDCDYASWKKPGDEAKDSDA